METRKYFRKNKFFLGRFIVIQHLKIGFVNKNLSRLAAGERTHNTELFHLINKTSCPRISNPETPLNE
jgi:hypothetical protein